MVSEVSSQKVDIDCTSSSDKNVSLRLKYLHPDYIDVIDDNNSHCDGVINKSRYPLALLAETCNSIGRTVPRSSSINTTICHSNLTQYQRHNQHQPLKITSTLLHTPPSSFSSSSCVFHSSFNSPSSSLSSNSNIQQPESRKRKYSNISSSDSSNLSTNPNYLPSNTELLSILTLLNRNFPLLNPSPPPSLSESKLNSKTIKYCMYCGKYIPNIHQLLQHIQSSHSESHSDMAFPFTLNHHNFSSNNKSQFPSNFNELSYLNFLKLFPEKSIFPNQPIKNRYYPFSPPTPPVLTPTIGPVHFNQNTNISFM